MADSDTTQTKQITASLEALTEKIRAAVRKSKVREEKAFNELKALTEDIRAKAAAREAKAAVREAMAAAREVNSGTTQYADIKKLLDSAATIIANLEKLDDADWKEAMAEVKRLHREAREKLFVRKANLLPTMAELACVGFLFGSLATRALF